MQDVPQREPGMTPYEIMLSESQERMLLVVKGREAEVERVFEKWDLHAVHIGEVTGRPAARERPRGDRGGDSEQGARRRSAALQPAHREPDYLCDARALDLSSLAPQGPPSRTLLTLLGRPSIASKRWIDRQDHHMVRTNTLVLPGMGAGVIRVKGTGRGLAMSVDGNGRYCYLDPFLGAQLAVAEAARNVACAGALPIGATNNLNFGNPEKPEVMWQLAEAVQGIGAACRALDIPITGGNVSLYNETDGRAILPTPVLGMVGVIEDASRAIGRDFGSRLQALGSNPVVEGENVMPPFRRAVTTNVVPAFRRAVTTNVVPAFRRAVRRRAEALSACEPGAPEPGQAGRERTHRPAGRKPRRARRQRISARPARPDRRRAAALGPGGRGPIAAFPRRRHCRGPAVLGARLLRRGSPSPSPNAASTRRRRRRG